MKFSISNIASSSLYWMLQLKCGYDLEKVIVSSYNFFKGKFSSKTVTSIKGYGFKL